MLPPKQTARVQITDIRFAKLGKDALNKVKAKQRKALRAKARKEGVAAKLAKATYEIMDAMIMIHRACVDDNKTSLGVVKAARMSGYLAYGVAENGEMVPATQDRS